LDSYPAGSMHFISPTYLAKVHFIKDDLIRMRDAPEPCDERERRHDCDCKSIVPF